MTRQFLHRSDVIAGGERCVANECGSMCEAAGFMIPLFLTASLTEDKRNRVQACVCVEALLPVVCAR